MVLLSEVLKPDVRSMSKTQNRRLARLDDATKKNQASRLCYESANRARDFVLLRRVGKNRWTRLDESCHLLACTEFAVHSIGGIPTSGREICLTKIAQLPQRVSAVDHDRRTGNVSSGIAGEVHGQRAQIFRLTEVSHGDLLFECFDDLWIL